MSIGFPKQEYWSGLPFPSPCETVITHKTILFVSVRVSVVMEKLYSHWSFSTQLPNQKAQMGMREIVKPMASSFLAWKMPQTEEPGRLQSMRPQREQD